MGTTSPGTRIAWGSNDLCSWDLKLWNAIHDKVVRVRRFVPQTSTCRKVPASLWSYNAYTHFLNQPLGLCCTLPKSWLMSRVKLFFIATMTLWSGLCFRAASRPSLCSHQSHHVTLMKLFSLLVWWIIQRAIDFMCILLRWLYGFLAFNMLIWWVTLFEISHSWGKNHMVRVY